MKNITKNYYYDEFFENFKKFYEEKKKFEILEKIKKERENKGKNDKKNEKNENIIHKKKIESNGFNIEVIFKLNKKKKEIEIKIENDNNWEIQPDFYQIENIQDDHQIFLRNEIKDVKNNFLIYI